MIFILSLVFALLCYLIAVEIIKQFSDGFDWFSAALYFIIFLVSCGLVYVMIFGVYYAIVQ